MCERGHSLLEDEGGRRGGGSGGQGEAKKQQKDFHPGKFFP
jgi:hypothetical protein